MAIMRITSGAHDDPKTDPHSRYISNFDDLVASAILSYTLAPPSKTLKSKPPP